MEMRYRTDENAKPIGVVLDIEEYERLREIEDEMEDIRRYDEVIAVRERGESNAIPWKEKLNARSKRSEKSSGGAVCYEVIVERRARKAVDCLPSTIYDRITPAINNLAEDSRPLQSRPTDNKDRDDLGKII